jgi:hypothetical protein
MLAFACALAASEVFAVSAQVTPIGPEFQVNSYVTDNQFSPEIARAGDGGFVAVWTSYDQDGANEGVFARRYSPSGAPQALEFQVNSYTSSFQSFPAIAIDTEGDFVVVWESVASQDGDGRGIFARRFDSTGAPLAFEFQANAFTTGDQRSPAVGTDADGDFVVAWLSSGQDGSGGGIFARRFDAAGGAQSAEIQVATYTLGDQGGRPAVAVGPAGNFVVVWQNPPSEVTARRFDSSGNALASEFRVDHPGINVFPRSPVASMNGDGEFVIAWLDGEDASGLGISARRYDVSGVALSDVLRINDYTIGDQQSPAVGIDGDGDLVLTWQSVAQDGHSQGVFARSFDASDVGLGREFQVNAVTVNDQGRPAVAVAANGDFVLTWDSNLQDGSVFGVFARRFAGSKKLDIDGNGVAEPLTDGLLLVRYAFGFRGATLIAGAVAVNCVRCTPALVEPYVASLAGITRSRRAGPEFQINSYTGGYQSSPWAAIDGEGDFVIAWHSAHDGAGYGIFARRYEESGAPSTGEIQVNTTSTGDQRDPSVAADADGDFVVAWDSSDGDGTGIFARRFNAAGAALGNEIQVNVYTTGEQIAPRVAMEADGDFAVAWHSLGQDGDAHGAFARRFSSAGLAQGGEIQINTYTTSSQKFPVPRLKANGELVVAWESYSQDASSGSIFARRFDTAGIALGGELQVNTFTSGPQYHPSIGGDPEGGFVVAWQSGQEGSSFGIVARRLDASGVPQGSEISVNVFTASSQSFTVASVAEDGAFVIAWQSDSQDGSGYGVFARRFDAAGVAQAAEFQIHSHAAGNQILPTLAMTPKGDFVVAWQSAGQDGASTGVFAQRFLVERAADIDGNGAVEPLTDGLLALRYLFGFRGPTLITGAVAPDCTRCTAAAIEPYLAAKV